MERDRKGAKRDARVAPARPGRRFRPHAHGVIAAIMLAALPLYLWGIRRDLPIRCEIDEPPFVQAARRIVATGSLNPGWFGHPGSTVIYPLTAAYYAFDLLNHRAFMTEIGTFYLLGRLLMVAYAIFSLPLILGVARLAFDGRVGVIAAWFTLVCPIVVDHVQQTRTDAPTMFFTLLALWLCLGLYERFTTRTAILAGVAVGLGVSTKYSLAALAVALPAVGASAVWRGRHTRAVSRVEGGQLEPRPVPWRGIAAGLIAIPLTFIVTTPYFFLDRAKVAQDLQTEARSSHLGADGLTPLQNFAWYMSSAIPGSMGGSRALLAVVGLGVVLWRRRPQQLLLLGVALAYLVEVSAHPLHWTRWLIPILPILMMFAADALSTAATQLAAGLRWQGWVVMTLLVVAVFSVSYRSVRAIIDADAVHAHPSTQILAREWLLQHLSPRSRIASEWFTAPLNETNFDFGLQFSLAKYQTLEAYRRAGYRYLLVSDAIYARYFGEPSRYPAEVAFYKQLFTEGNLLQEIAPSALHSGPTVRIYELPAADETQAQ